MNLKLNLLWIVGLFVILSLTFGCKKTQVTKPMYHGDYPTENLRQMWSFCVRNFQMKAPQTPPFLVGQMCDCYLDEMRKKHPAKEVNNLDDDATREMGQHLIRVCNIYPEPKKV
jgi:hypothetical protein